MDNSAKTLARQGNPVLRSEPPARPTAVDSTHRGAVSSSMALVIYIKNAAANDSQAVCQLFSSQLHRKPNEELIRAALDVRPSALAFNDRDLIGFAYCGYMAPDIMEIMNILVSEDFRNQGVGVKILTFLEGNMPQEIAAIMLANSSLYPNVKGEKRPANSFYIRSGYRIVSETVGTRIFWKEI